MLDIIVGHAGLMKDRFKVDRLAETAGNVIALRKSRYAFLGGGGMLAGLRGAGAVLGERFLRDGD